MRGEIVIAIIGAVIAFSFLGCVSKKTYLRDLENARDIGYNTGKIESQREIIDLKEALKRCKQTMVVPIQANPKGIQTPLTDEFWNRIIIEREKHGEVLCDDKEIKTPLMDGFNKGELK